jgi:protein-tyrosine phosphatase
MSDPTAIDIQFDPTIQRMSGVATHGMTPFDVPYINKIAYNLYQGGCTNGLILPTYIKHLVSLYPWEAYTVNHELDSVMQVKMYDSLDQAYEQVDAIANWINVCRESGPVLVHCQAGLNRSSLVATRALMMSGKTADEAISLIREKRSPACLCNPAFESHLRSLDQVTTAATTDPEDTTQPGKNANITEVQS